MELQVTKTNENMLCLISFPDKASFLRYSRMKMTLLRWKTYEALWFCWFSDPQLSFLVRFIKKHKVWRLITDWRRSFTRSLDHRLELSWCSESWPSIFHQNYLSQHKQIEWQLKSRCKISVHSLYCTPVAHCMQLKICSDQQHQVTSILQKQRSVDKAPWLCESMLASPYQCAKFTYL